MLSLDEALSRLTAGAAAARIGEIEIVSTFDALGRVLAADMVSAIDVPAADNSSMDGYALRAADAPQAGQWLPVSQRIPAGIVGVPLLAGTAARIFTGAQLPAGADAIVMQEQCEAGEAGVRFNVAAQPGQWIRRRGEDVGIGATVLAQGSRLTPQALGLAAGVGAATLSVVRRPRVALFSTGDELVMPGAVAPAALPPGAIYNSNRFTLRGLLQAAGCEVSDLGIVRDDRASLADGLKQVAGSHDLILTTGGVSTGEEDHVKASVESAGTLVLWRMAIKPGRPVAMGIIGGTPFIGLPGNPVASFVTFVHVVRPTVLALAGATQQTLIPMPVRAAFAYKKKIGRREYVRVVLRKGDGGVLEATKFPREGAGLLSSLVDTDGLVELGEEIAEVEPGQSVGFLSYASLM